MTEEQENVEAAVSEQPNVNLEEKQEERMVPLAALEAERRKRQEAEANWNRMKEELNSKEPAEDPHGLVEKQDLHEKSALTKREILEQVYQDINPEGVRKIEKYLKPILDKKPWLADSIDNAPNRYARAHEIVTDYLHLVEEKSSRSMSSAPADAKRMVENSQKPGSPVAMTKSANPTGIELLKSVQGKKEWSQVREQMRRGDRR